MNKKYFFSRAIMLTLAIDIYLALLFAKVTGLIDGTENVRLILMFFIVLLGCIGSMEMIIKKVRINRYLIVMYTYLFLVSIMLILYGQSNITNFLNYLYFPFISIATYTTYNNIKDEIIFDNIIRLQHVLFYVFIFIFLKTQIFSHITSREWINTIYYIVFALPFLFLIKNNISKNIAIGIALVAIFLSLKRGAFFACLLGILIYKYGLIKDKKHTKRNVYRLIKISTTIFFLAITLNLMISIIFDYNIIQRVIEGFKDGGSGRDYLLEDIINRIINSSFVEIIIGHEMIPTSYESTIDMSVHNDYLEVFWRGGILLFTSYISITINIFKNIRIIKYRNKQIYSVLISSLCMFLIISALSQLIYVPSYSALIAMVWSFCLCKSKGSSNTNTL